MLIQRGYIFIITMLVSLGSYQGYSQVPNIVLTDINGNERNLYQSLDDGKIVVVEIFATWCFNCWELNKSEKLERLYSTYGPTGTNQLEVFYIEADPATDLSSIFGNESFGDWTEGITYPIFNPDQISLEFLEIFAGKGVPTTNVICPETREIVADIFQSDLAETIEIFQTCNTISDVRDMQIVKPVFSEIGICKPTDVVIELLNTGTETITELSLDVTLGVETLFDFISTDVNFEPGSIISVNIGEYSLPSNIDTQQLILNIRTEDDVLSNNTLPLTYKHAEEVLNELHLKITPDVFSSIDSTRWWIENSVGEVVVPVTFIGGAYKIEETITLENNDCFTFIIQDNYGDGLIFGDIELSTSSGVVLFDEEFFRTRGEVSFDHLGFVTTGVNTSLETAYDLVLQSTVVSNELNAQIEMPEAKVLELSVVSLQGQVLFSKKLQGGLLLTENVDVSHLNNGLHFLQLSTPEGVLTKKFIKQ